MATVNREGTLPKPLSGMKAIQDFCRSIKLPSSEASIINMIKKEKMPVKKLGGIWESDEDLITKWRHDRLIKSDPFNFKKYDLDETIIDERLTRRRCKTLVNQIRCAHLKVTKEDYAAIEKKQPHSGKKVAKYAYIIRWLSSIINDKSLPDEFKIKYTEDRQCFQKLQREDKKKPEQALKWNQFRDQIVYDLCSYVIEKTGFKGMQCFRLVADILTAKGRGGLDAKQIETIYNNRWIRDDISNSKKTKAKHLAR